MRLTYDNPIFKRLVRAESSHRPDKLTWMIFSLATLTSVGAMWLSLLDYPRMAFDRLPFLLAIAAIILSMMLLSVTISTVRAETRAEGYPLLFMTNIGRERVVWGMVLALLWRWRQWIALYGWLVWCAGWLFSIGLYNVVHDEVSIGQSVIVAGAAQPAFNAPPFYSTLIYGVMWGAFTVGSVLAVMGAGIIAGFRGRDLTSSVLRAGATVLLLHAPAALLLLPVMLVERTTFQVPVLALVLLFTVAVAMTMARRWGLDPHWVWHSFPEVVTGTVFLWLLWVVVLFSISRGNPYGRFLVLYTVAVWAIAGQLRLRKRTPLAARVLLSGMSTIFILIYMGLLGRQSLLSVLAVIAFVFAVQVGRWQLVGMLARTPRTQPRFIANSAIQVVLAVGLYTLTNWIYDVTNDSRFALIPTLATLIVIGWCFTLAATWRTFRGLTALMTVIIQMAFVASMIHDGYFLGRVVEPEASGSLTNWWFAAALIWALIGAGLAGMRGGVRHVWPSEYIV